MPRSVTALVLVLCLAATLAGAFGGPALGDHEAIVGLCAREMRTSGDWLVPQFLDHSFIRKTPLPFWLVAAASYVFPNDPVSGLPVTQAAMRLPSALCGLGTVLILWRLAASMFTARVGVVTAVVASSTIAILLYSPNATAEMVLTFCCTWTYAHFWFAATARSKGRRVVHALLVYVAFGFAMLAKGPAPLPLVAFPLAVWWFTHRPLRILARSAGRCWRRALAYAWRDLPRRIGMLFTRLQLLPGVILFGLVFVSWVLAVAARHEHAWDMWNWQFLQRAQGDYTDTRDRNLLYYVPRLGGLVLPWTFLIIEAAIAPWVRRHARRHRGLLYVGLWALLGTIAMSLMEFKKPYYVLPAAPGLIVLLAFAAERFFSTATATRSVGERWNVRIGLIIFAAAVPAGAWYWLAGEETAAPAALMWLVIGLIVLFVATAIYLYHSGRRWIAFAATALAGVAGFHIVWFGFASSIENVDKVRNLVAALDNAGVPRDARLIWADRRPDARLVFYFGRRSEYMINPDEIVAKFPDRSSKQAEREIQATAYAKALELLRGTEPVYLIIRRDRFKLAGDGLGLYAEPIAVAMSGEAESHLDWVVVTNARRLTGASN